MATLAGHLLTKSMSRFQRDLFRRLDDKALTGLTSSQSKAHAYLKNKNMWRSRSEYYKPIKDPDFPQRNRPAGPGPMTGVGDDQQMLLTERRRREQLKRLEPHSMNWKGKMDADAIDHMYQMKMVWRRGGDFKYGLVRRKRNTPSKKIMGALRRRGHIRKSMRRNQRRIFQRLYDKALYGLPAGEKKAYDYLKNKNKWKSRSDYYKPDNDPDFPQFNQPAGPQKLDPSQEDDRMLWQERNRRQNAKYRGPKFMMDGRNPDDWDSINIDRAMALHRRRRSRGIKADFPDDEKIINRKRTRPKRAIVQAIRRGRRR